MNAHISRLQAALNTLVSHKHPQPTLKIHYNFIAVRKIFMSTSAEKERIDKKLVETIAKGVANNHRTVIRVKGKLREVVHHIHSLLSRHIVRPSVVWVYEKDLDIKADKISKAKKRRSAGDASLTNFESFVVNTEITYVLHHECSKVLGTTTDMCVIQEFSKIKANALASVVESVRGGGIVVVPVEETESIFTNRLYTLLARSDGQIMIDGSLGVISSEDRTGDARGDRDDRSGDTRDGKNGRTRDARADRNNQNTQENTLIKETAKVLEKNIEKIKEETNPLNPLSVISANSTTVLLQQCKTKDQIEAVVKMGAALDQRGVLAVTADRGRGKSAALGLGVSLAVVKGMNDILITSPHLTNVQTLFEFVIIGLSANGYKEQIDYHVEYSKTHKKVVEKVVISKTHYQVVRFSVPHKLLYSPSLLVVDEAAAVPLSVLKEMMGVYPVLLSSTTAGYEGTGQALSLKFFKAIRPEMVRLEEPIRYGRGDPVEAWLNASLSLAPEIPPMASFPKKERCKIFVLNKPLLFSGMPETEKVLSSLSSILLSGHYKNSPNDLQLLAENSRHFLLCLLTEEGRVLGLCQAAIEGGESPAHDTAYQENRTEEGDMIPWSLSQYYLNLEFFKLVGIRVVRIAIHPDAQSMGYGSYLINTISQTVSGQQATDALGRAEIEDAPYKRDTPSTTGKKSSENHNHNQSGHKKFSTSVSKSQTNANRAASNVLFCSLNTLEIPPVHYIGASFGLTQRLFEFWDRLGMSPLYLKHTECKSTGEHSIIMVRALGIAAHAQIKDTNREFARRFVELLPGTFKSLPSTLASQLIAPVSENALQLENDHRRRMQEYARCNLDLRILLDILPSLSKSVLLSKKIATSQIQKVILIALGLQHKTLEEVAKELNMSYSQVKMVLAKSMCALSE